MTEIRDDVDQQEEFRPIGDATYCPEDNKLRFYPDGRFSDEVKNRFKSAGFKWASKQGIYVAPAWTPDREDLLIELCGEIGDEDYSPEERSADRAERFSGYRDKRRSEAGGYADRFDAGPSAFGHQSQRRAERQANRHDRLRTRSLTQWDKAEYWQERTERVIGHALYKSSPEVRRGRILVIEAEQRKHLKDIDQAKKRRELWKKVRDEQDADKAEKLAKWASGNVYDWTDYQHPRQPERPKTSLWSLLTLEVDPITAYEAAAMYLDARPIEPGAEGTLAHRWAKHFELRLAYENAMLENEGGKASEVEIVPGGFVGNCQIQKVNRSNVTGRIVSIQVYGVKPRRNVWNEDKPAGLFTINIERKGTEIGYRAPTAEELKAFHTAQKVAKAERKATTPKAPSLINPTEEDAQRLQDLWNRHQDATQTRREYPYNLKTTAQTPRPMTQAEYSERSKGTYSHFETVSVCIDGFKPRTHYGEPVKEESRPICCKIRTAPYSGTEWDYVDRVVIITDKPQKPLPIDWEKAEAAIPQDPFFEAYQKWVEELATAHGGVRFAHQTNPNDERRRISVTFEDGTRETFKAETAAEHMEIDPYSFMGQFQTWAKSQEEKFQLSN